MTVRVYKSTDASAPQLNGLAGSLITVLDAVLVNGYGTMAAAGWTKPFSGTNKAVYRSSTANGGSGLYYRVLDNGTLNYNTSSGTASRVSGVRGYESMTTVDTGLNAFPLSTNVYDNYTVWEKSVTSDSTLRDWIIIADQYTMYIFIDVATNLTTSGYVLFTMGEFYSYVSNFAWKGILTISNSAWGMNYKISAGTSAYNPRKYNNVLNTGNGADLVGNFTTTGGNPSGYGVSGFPGYYVNCNMITYPHPIDGKLHLTKIFIGNNNRLAEGFLRGIYAPLHVKPLNNLDLYYGTGSLSGKTLQAFNISPSGGSSIIGQIMIEISDTWAYSV